MNSTPRDCKVSRWPASLGAATSSRSSQAQRALSLPAATQEQSAQRIVGDAVGEFRQDIAVAGEMTSKSACRPTAGDSAANLLLQPRTDRPSRML